MVQGLATDRDTKSAYQSLLGHQGAKRMSSALSSRSFLRILEIKGKGGKAYSRPEGQGLQSTLVASALGSRYLEKYLST